MLVTLSINAAKQYFDSQENANHRLFIATIAQQFVVADEQLRVERGMIDTAGRSNKPAGASDLDRITQFHARGRAALATIAAFLKTENGAIGSPERQRLAQM